MSPLHFLFQNRETEIVVDIPRVKCSIHGLVMTNEIWSQRNNCRMALFETMILDWLQGTSIQTASQEIGLSWKVAVGAMNQEGETSFGSEGSTAG